MYNHYEHYKGLDYYYHFRNRHEIPSSLKIEPIYDFVGGGRTADGSVYAPHKVIIGYNVTGIYDTPEVDFETMQQEMARLLNKPLMTEEELREYYNRIYGG